MPGTTTAKRYAKALLSLATAQGTREQVGTALSELTAVLADPTIERVIALPTLPVKARKEIVEHLVTTMSLDPLVGNFLRVLADNDRLTVLANIDRAYQLLLERALGRVRAKIQSAATLSAEELSTIVEAFSRLTNMTVVPTVEVKPELLGGVVVEIAGQVYDASLKTQLRRLGDTLAADGV